MYSCHILKDQELILQKTLFLHVRHEQQYAFR